MFYSASLRGSSKHGSNEDFVCINDHNAVLADGATALVPGNWSDYPSDPTWFSHRLSTVVSNLCEQNPDVSTKDIIKSALSIIQTEWSSFAPSDASLLSMPSSSLIIVRWNNNILDIAAIGDSPLLVKTVTGEEHIFESIELQQLDRTVKNEMMKLKDTTSMTFNEIRTAVDPMLKDHRKLKNTPEGYWVADLSSTWIEHMDYSTFHIDDIAYVFMCSDGYAAAVDYGLFLSLSILADATAQGQGMQIIRDIRLIEETDSTITSYMRFKKSDDCTFAFIDFQR